VRGLLVLKLDFATIVYNSQIELNLLRLQAKSLSFVDKELVNKIFVFYNDKGHKNLSGLLRWYPAYLRDRVKIIYRDDVLEIADSNWFNQQLMKLLIADYVESEMYMILDAKDHFIRAISKETLFPYGKPFMVIGHSGLYGSYLNCLDYFGAICPFGSFMTQSGPNVPTGGVLVTGPPYVFIKTHVIELRKLISRRENQSFEKFFLAKAARLEVTEFFLYGAYLISKNLLEEYSLVNYEIREGVYGHVSDPWNAIDTKDRVFSDDRYMVFSLHRNTIPEMDRNYKNKLIDIYKYFYTEDTVDYISNRILRLGSPVSSHHFYLAAVETISAFLNKALVHLRRKVRLIWKYQIRPKVSLPRDM